VIIGLILQQALLIGALGYGLAYWLGTFAFPRFPRRVVIEPPDLLLLAGVVAAISVVASLIGSPRRERRTQQGAVMSARDQEPLAIEALNLTKIYGSATPSRGAQRRDGARGRGEWSRCSAERSGKSTLLTAVGLINPRRAARIWIGGELVLEADRHVSICACSGGGISALCFRRPT
jgi:hypothetical protein